MHNCITFKNVYGDLISAQQLEIIKDYRIDYDEDNSLKKSEYYQNKTLVSVNYYLEDNEIYTDVLNLYDSNIRINCFQFIQVLGIYKEVKAIKFKFGILQSETRLIEEITTGDIIYKKEVDSNGSFLKLEKYFFENDNLKYIFEYFENGNIYMINIFNGIDSEQLHYSSSDCQNFNWTGIEYYQNGLQLFPN